MQTDKIEKNINVRNYLYDFSGLIDFQLGIANRWLERGNIIEDIFAKFFFYFTGFNAIYFLWKKIDKINRRNEKECIKNLLKKFSRLKTQEILDKVKTSVDYFINREPIKRMDKRTNKQFIGDDSDGCNWKSVLQNNDKSASEKLIALGNILYLIRCNLFHGSKSQLGDDRKIIEKSVEPLRVFLEETISLTKQQCTWNR